MNWYGALVITGIGVLGAGAHGLAKAMLQAEPRLRAWLERREHDRLLDQFGGTQNCPWCRQCAQSSGPWSLMTWKRDQMLDVLTCGVCGGTSLWRFEIGMFYVGPLDPPQPAWPEEDWYDIKCARLSGAPSAG